MSALLIAILALVLGFIIGFMAGVLHAAGQAVRIIKERTKQ